MEVILLEKIANLGLMGDQVRVKPGFARNFLFPQKKALKNTKENRQYFEKYQIEIEARNLELKKEAEEVLAKVDAQEFVIVRQASETGSLYGSVTKRDIADTSAESGLSIDRKQIELDRPIKEIGLHSVKVLLHPEVIATVIVNVARSATEAEEQSPSTNPEASEDAIEEPVETDSAAPSPVADETA